MTDTPNAQHAPASQPAESDSSRPATGEVTKPVPPRYWWLKRLALVAAVFILALVGLRIWWGHVAESRLQAKIDEYRAAGQPILVEDFQPTPLPNEENGAHFLKLAGSRMTCPEHTSTKACVALMENPQPSAEDLATVGQLIEQNRELYRLVRAARACDAADWQLGLSSPMFAVPLPNLSEQRELARRTVLAALYHHQVGNDADAIEELRDALGIGRHARQIGPFVIAALVANAVDTYATVRIQSIAPTLRIATEPPAAGASARPTQRAQVQALIDELLDEQDVQEYWLRGMYGERMLQLDGVQYVCRRGATLGAIYGGGSPGTFATRIAALLLGPAWKLDAIGMIEQSTALAHAGKAPNWPAAEALLPPPPKGYTQLEHITRMPSAMLPPNLHAVVQRHYGVLGDRRAAATALAARLYEIDHGRQPTALGELVPDYLPVIPLDPLDADGAEVRYYLDPTTQPASEGRVEDEPDVEHAEQHEQDQPDQDQPQDVQPEETQQAPH